MLFYLLSRNINSLGFSDVKKGNLVIQVDFVLFLNPQKEWLLPSSLPCFPMNVKIKLLCSNGFGNTEREASRPEFVQTPNCFSQLWLDLARLDTDVRSPLSMIMSSVIPNVTCRMFRKAFRSSPTSKPCRSVTSPTKL